MARATPHRQEISVVQDDVRQQLGPYDDFLAFLVVNQAEFPELVHKVSNPGARGTHHLR